MTDRPTLSPGQTIGVMAPSSYVEREDIEKSAALLEARGYKVFVHPQTFERQGQSAGTVLQKSLALQGLWQRDDIHAIWCAGGGNRSLSLLDSINFEKMKGISKPLIGFSDATALVNAVYAHTGQASYHGQVFKNLHSMETAQLDHMLQLLSGEPAPYPCPDCRVVKSGHAEGILIGGNLSLFQYLPQSLPGEWWQGGILFLEDCNEELSKIDRMFTFLQLSGVLDNISGLVLGQFTDLQDNGRPFGFTLDDIIQEHVDGLDIPVVMNAPFGHGRDLYCLPIGVKASLQAEEHVKLVFSQ